MCNGLVFSLTGAQKGSLICGQVLYRWFNLYSNCFHSFGVFCPELLIYSHSYKELQNKIIFTKAGRNDKQKILTKVFNHGAFE